jgi:hypothetical protein
MASDKQEPSDHEQAEEGPLVVWDPRDWCKKVHSHDHDSDIDPDLASTIAYSLPPESDSAYVPELFDCNDNASGDLATEDGSSHGTIDEFCW